jgi:hypothetical protein
MSRPHVWASKVAALIQGGNTPAALAQIKVAPSVTDVEQLRTLSNAKLLARTRFDAATRDQITNWARASTVRPEPRPCPR